VALQRQFRFQQGHRGRLPVGAGRLSTQCVERLAPSDGGEPGTRSGRDAVHRPALQRFDHGLPDGILGATRDGIVTIINAQGAALLGVDAHEALAIGLVDQVHPAADVYAKAVEWAAQFVGGPRLALRAAKSAIDRGIEVDLQTGLEIERAEFASLFATDDRLNGMTSFIDNGPGKATFTGS
jgi:PAS domain-containing protein